MKKIKEYLKRDYKENILKDTGECLLPEALYSYAKGGLSSSERDAAESHIAGCYHCLDILVSINKGVRFQRIKGVKMRKEHIFLLMAVMSFILSFVLSSYFLQLLTATVIFGIKWIIDSKSTRMLIMVHEAWKKGGDNEALRVIKDLNMKKDKNIERFM